MQSNFFESGMRTPMSDIITDRTGIDSVRSNIDPVRSVVSTDLPDRLLYINRNNIKVSVFGSVINCKDYDDCML